jgi:hypothetical protein
MQPEQNVRTGKITERYAKHFMKVHKNGLSEKISENYKLWPINSTSGILAAHCNLQSKTASITTQNIKQY